MSSCGRWMDFLDEIFAADWLSRLLLQRWFAYHLVRDQGPCGRVVALCGGPASGKSTIGAVLHEVAGVPRVTADWLRFDDGYVAADAASVGQAVFVEGFDPSHRAAEHVKRAVAGDRMPGGVILPSRLTFAVNEPDAIQERLGQRAIVLNTRTQRGREEPGLKSLLCAEAAGIREWASEQVETIVKHDGIIDW